MYQKKFNATTHGASGKFDEQIVYAQRNGKTTITIAKPKKERKLTQKEQEVQDRFTEATLWGKWIMSTPENQEPYVMAVGEKGNIYQAAINDFLSVPMVELVRSLNYTGVPGGQIVVLAQDDVKIDSVIVELFNPNGDLLESGAAQEYSKNSYRYTATTENPAPNGTRVVVTVKDLPGNAITKEVLL
ncbi:hypothetical protein [uncultured Chitinophaga sp.]|uniref:hypothetical protein n=1 Tax=uncultured Chitinophaga sp. TaxID=339340 RepID=UPI0025DC0673|nr:hypothetical protein [uncultured Chitinophaga sp.]